jgi:hypothetical protein
MNEGREEGLDAGGDDGFHTPDAGVNPGAVEVVCGPLLCRMEFWTEEQWAALPEPDRPTIRRRVPGRGWLGAVMVAILN